MSRNCSLTNLFLLIMLTVSGCSGADDDGNLTERNPQSTSNPYFNGYMLASTESTYRNDSDINEELRTSRYLHTYDPEAGTTTVDFYNANNSSVYEQHVHTYNEIGVLVESNIFSRDQGSILDLFTTIAYQHNENGYLVSARTFYTDPTALNSVTEFFYNDDGTLTKVLVFDGLGSEYYETHFIYDANGHVDYAERRSNSNEYLITDYSTSSSGKITNLQDFDSNGAALENLSFIYDENGNLIELTSSSSYSTLTEKYFYTPTNRLMENTNSRLQKLNFTNLEFD